jgi:long-chain acyl-CoA synthetase
MLTTAARDYPERTFLRWCRGDARIRWTYAEAALRIDALVAQLDALGVAPGDRVVVHTAAMVPSILFDLACACAGVAFTPIETASIPSVLELCAQTDARAVLTTPDRADRYDGRPVVVEDGMRDVHGDAAAAIARLHARAAKLTPDDVYMLQPTSGTTGGSKLVIRHHAAFVRIARLLGCGLERTSEPPARVLMVAALTHGMGQYLLAIAMDHAAELAVTTAIDVAASIGEIRELDPTYIGLTPRVLRSLVHQLGGATAHIFGASARTFLTGGAPPDKDLLAAVARSGVDVIEAYGASEFSVVAMTRPGAWRPDILGHVVDDVRLRAGDDGELEAWTPVLMRGYHGAPELTRAAFTADGFYRTGDKVELGPDGEFRYLGRVVDSFNLFDGSHVAPGPIEDALARLPWIEQVLLLGDQRPYLTGLVVPHPALRAAGPSLRRLGEVDIGRVCAAFDLGARVRRIALLAEPLPADVYAIVGHGKVRRARGAACERFASVVEALYGGAARTDIVDIPGAASERRGASRANRRWLLRIGDVLAYARDVSRSGVFVEDADRLADGTHAIELIDADGRTLRITGELVRREAGGSALRWTGDAAALAELAHRLPP